MAKTLLRTTEVAGNGTRIDIAAHEHACGHGAHGEQYAGPRRGNGRALRHAEAGLWRQGDCGPRRYAGIAGRGRGRAGPARPPPGRRRALGPIAWAANTLVASQGRPAAFAAAIIPTQTGLAILAFQAAGYFEFNERKYSKVVRQGLNWLADHQSKDGQIGPEVPNTYMYEHGIAAFALADSCAAARGMKKQPYLCFFEAARKAVAFIESQQHNDGGWRGNRPTGNSDTSVSGWQVLALKLPARPGSRSAPNAWTR